METLFYPLFRRALILEKTAQAALAAVQTRIGKTVYMAEPIPAGVEEHAYGQDNERPRKQCRRKRAPSPQPGVYARRELYGKSAVVPKPRTGRA